MIQLFSKKLTLIEMAETTEAIHYIAGKLGLKMNCTKTETLCELASAIPWSHLVMNVLSMWWITSSTLEELSGVLKGAMSKTEHQNWESFGSIQRVRQGVERHQSGHQPEILQCLCPFHTSVYIGYWTPTRVMRPDLILWRDMHCQ